jgi:hypothetical protein
MNDAQRMWDAAVEIAKAFTSSPEMQAFYREQGRKRAEALKREQEAVRAKREAEEREKQRARSYDVWALSGGADECTQFGIMDGCKPNCPVFMRGACEMQDENEKLFAET